MSELKKIPFSKPNIVFDPQKVLEDYRLAVLSRQCSLLVRKEVFSGRAKFGIYGDGKELCQIALANSMRLGDYFSGYYRDQTVAAANGDMTWPQYFAQLYGHPDIQFDPHSGGRQASPAPAPRRSHRQSLPGQLVGHLARRRRTAGLACTVALVAVSKLPVMWHRTLVLSASRPIDRAEALCHLRRLAH